MLAIGCSNNNPNPVEAAGGGETAGTSSQSSAGGAANGGRPSENENGGEEGAAPPEHAMPGGAGAGGGDDGLVDLPAGSHEVSDIVNLVDPEAATELDEFLSSSGNELTRSLNLFLTHYEEQYDFVFLFTDHALPAGAAAGRFMTVTSNPRVGTGATSQYLAEGIVTNGRTKGAMAVKYGSGPFSHEIAHYWAVNLDRSFGFGVGKAYQSSVHWGYAGVNGMLGGFDPATLVCETPSGGVPPNCAPLDSGRYRYVVGSFNPGANSVDYAPLELYLMGLADADEVPSEIPVLQDAEDVPESFDRGANTEVVEAAGIKIVTMADIIARYGKAVALPESERHFTSAFVVISAEPASDEVLAEVATRAAAFGDRGMHGITTSFASDTGGRATMTTTLGARRAASDPPPTPRTAFTCDVVKQDCETGLTCYGSFCALPGAADVGEDCKLKADCVSGSRCALLDSNGVGKCARYCDRNDTSGPLACAALCTSIITYVDSNNDPTETVCRPQ